MAHTNQASKEEKEAIEATNESQLSPPRYADRETTIVSKEGTIVNASGHEDQLQRQYGLLAVCGLALCIDNAWIAFGGSLSVAVLNGGPPGILYEFIVACVYYAFIGACIAELASSVPSSGGVYHWASITPGRRWGRVLGFFSTSLGGFSTLRPLCLFQRTWWFKCMPCFTRTS